MVEGLRPEYPDEVESPERILTRAEVVGAIGRHVENYAVSRELSDGNGIYLFEVTASGGGAGDVNEYSYRRKGSFPESQTLKTNISVAYFDADGIPEGGKVLSNYDEETGEWK